MASLATGGSRVAPAILFDGQTKNNFTTIFPLMADVISGFPPFVSCFASGRHKSPRRIAFVVLLLTLGFLIMILKSLGVLDPWLPRSRIRSIFWLIGRQLFVAAVLQFPFEKDLPSRRIAPVFLL